MSFAASFVSDRKEKIIRSYIDFIFPFLLSVFIAGFVFVPETRMHRDVFYLVIIAFFPFLLVRKDSYRFFSLSQNRVFLLLVGYLFLSLLWSSGVDFVDIYNRLRWGLLYVLFVFAVCLAFRKGEPSILMLSWVLALSAVTVSIYSFFVAYYPFEDFNARLGNAVFYSDNPIAGSVGIAVAAIFSAWAFFRTRNNLKYFFLVSGLICVAFLFFAQSRGLLLSLFVAAILASASMKSWVLLCGMFSFFLALFFGAELLELGGAGFYARQDSYRLEIWRSWAVQVWNGPIVFGEGLLGGTRDYYVPALDKFFASPHNLFIVLQIKGGVVALLIAFFMYYFAFSKASTLSLSPRSDWLPLAMLVFGVFHMSLTVHEFIYRMDPHVWLGLLLPLGLVAAFESKGERT